jgi:hypothetical protein
MAGSRHDMPVGAMFLAGVVLVGGCESDRRQYLGGPTDTASAQAVPTMSARRPKRSYYLANDDSRCFAYWVDDDSRSVKREDMCPRELEPGERLRLLGRTCMRESADRTRNLPVKCPRQLVKSAEHDREGKGPMQLRRAENGQ